MSTKKGAIIGLGYWGPNIVRNLLKIPGVTLTYVFDLSPVRRKSFKRDFPTIPFATSYDVILGSDVDFVIIATPLETHFSLAEQALKAGKHVLLEKPLTQTSEQAKTLIALAKRKKKSLMVGHTFVYTDAVKKMSQIIQKPHFGQLLYFDSTRINLGRIRSDTNVIWDLASHDFAILDTLVASKPRMIHAVGSSPISGKHIEIAHIFVTYDKSFTAHIHVSWLSPVKIRSILLGGNKQMVQYNDIEPSEKVRIYNSSITIKPEEITSFTPAYRSGTVEIPYLPQKEALLTELEHFVSCLRSDTRPQTPGEAGLRVVRMLEAADESLRTQKTVKL